MNRLPALAAAFFLCASINCTTMAASPSGGQPDTLQAALKLYNQKQYGPASQALLKITHDQPRNTTAALYLGHCYYALGHAAAAGQYYKWIADNFPMSSEAATAQQMLSRLGLSSGQAAAGAATSPDSSAAAKAPDAPVSTSGMFSVVKAQGTHDPCTADFIKEVKDSVDKFPKGLVRYMSEHGCKICITPSLIDRNPELRNSRPRGYEDGNTYKNTPAMFEAPTVVVCQYYQVGESDEWRKQDDPMGALRHEFGHAIDHFMDYPSYTEKFRHMYYLDRAKVDPEYKSELNYFIQPGTESGGPSECFAEACCIILGGRKANSWQEKRDQHFKDAFPNIMRFAQEKIDQTK